MQDGNRCFQFLPTNDERSLFELVSIIIIIITIRQGSESYKRFEESETDERMKMYTYNGLESNEHCKQQESYRSRNQIDV